MVSVVVLSTVVVPSTAIDTGKEVMVGIPVCSPRLAFNCYASQRCSFLDSTTYITSGDIVVDLDCRRCSLTGSHRDKHCRDRRAHVPFAVGYILVGDPRPKAIVSIPLWICLRSLFFLWGRMRHGGRHLLLIPQDQARPRHGCDRWSERRNCQSRGGQEHSHLLDFRRPHLLNIACLLAGDQQREREERVWDEGDE